MKSRRPKASSWRIFAEAVGHKCYLFRPAAPRRCFRRRVTATSGLSCTPRDDAKTPIPFDKKFPRSNLDGIGTRVIATPDQTPSSGTMHRSARDSSAAAVTGGLGDRSKADAVRLRRPSGVEQAELNLPADQLHTIEEVRRDSSCPLLFAWNGRRFEFVTDFLGGGGIGYMVAPASIPCLIRTKMCASTPVNSCPMNADTSS